MRLSGQNEDEMYCGTLVSLPADRLMFTLMPLVGLPRRICLAAIALGC